MSQEYHVIGLDTHDKEKLCLKVHRPSSHRYGTHRPKILPFLKALMYTAISTYPPVVFVFKLSSYQGKHFVPCNEKACAYTKIIPTENIASTLHFGQDEAEFFPLVTNGIDSTNRHIMYSPRCKNKSPHAMRELCLKPDTLKRIENTLNTSVSKTVYIVFVFFWFIFKLLHDGLLLAGGFSEFCTLGVGLVSVFFQLCAVAASFAWTMGAAAVFVAPLKEIGNCACYYQLPDLETLLAIANPLLLFTFACIKLANVHRAVVSGDYLYFMTYDVPFNVVEHSMRDPTSSLLVSTIRGQVPPYPWDPPERPQRQPLSLGQCRWQWAVLRMFFDVALFPLVVFAFAVAVGPVMVRLTFLVTGDDSLFLSLPLVGTILAGPVLSVKAHSASFFRFIDGTVRLKQVVLSWNPYLRSFYVAEAIIEIVLSVGATYVLVKPFLRKVDGNEAILDSEACLECALAMVVWLLFGVVRYMYYELIMPPFYGLSVKARSPFYPSEYLEWADKFPEFDVDEEVQIADKHLEAESHMFGLDLAQRKAWTQEWEETIQWPTRDEHHTHFGQRLRIILECGAYGEPETNAAKE